MGTVLCHRTAQAGAIFNCLFGGGGLRSPRDGPPDVVLTAWVPDGLNHVWRSPLLSGRAYLMSVLS
jgi:hypothetical protein